MFTQLYHDARDNRLLVVLLIQRHKSQSLWVEVQLNLASRSVTVLGDNEVGDVFAFGIGVVVGFAVDKHNDVGVLLD